MEYLFQDGYGSERKPFRTDDSRVKLLRHRLKLRYFAHADPEFFYCLLELKTLSPYYDVEYWGCGYEPIDVAISTPARTVCFPDP